MAALGPLTMMKLLRIRKKVESGKMTLAEAETKAKPFMDRMNAAAAKNAQQKGEKYTPITYEGFLWIQQEIERRNNK